MKTMNDKDLDRIRKSLEEAVKNKNRDNIIIALADLQIFIDDPHYGYREDAFEIQESLTHDLLEIGICKDIENVDEIFKEVDALKKEIKEEPKPPKVKLTEEEKIEKKIEKLVKDGLPPEKAEEFVVEKEIERKGYKICPVCTRVIGPKEDAIRVGNKWYHPSCYYEEQQDIASEAEEKPFIVKGEVQYCPYCSKDICDACPKNSICPPSEIYKPPEVNLECVWFCSKCFTKWLDEAKKYGKDISGNIWELYLDWMPKKSFEIIER